MTYRFLVMAIHLNSRGVSFVIFEGELAPLDWSAVELRGSEKREKALVRIDALLARFRPNVVVLEDMPESDTRRPLRIRSLNEAIAGLAERYALPTFYLSRATVRQQFAYLGS